MSERYYITGVQIGVIKALTMKVTERKFRYLSAKDAAEIEAIMKEIEDKQFVGKITQPEEKVIIAG